MANEYFGKPIRAATPTLRKEWAGSKAFTGGNGDTKLYVKDPGVSATLTVDAATAGQQYVAEVVNLSLSATASVYFAKATGAETDDIVWGPHSLVAGFYSFYFPGGLRFGSGGTPYIDVSTGDGTVDVQGYIEPTA